MRCVAFQSPGNLLGTPAAREMANDPTLQTRIFQLGLLTVVPSLLCQLHGYGG